MAGYSGIHTLTPTDGESERGRWRSWGVGGIDVAAQEDRARGCTFLYLLEQGEGGQVVQLAQGTWLEMRQAAARVALALSFIAAPAGGLRISRVTQGALALIEQIQAMEAQDDAQP